MQPWATSIARALLVLSILIGSSAANAQFSDHGSDRARFDQICLDNPRAALEERLALDLRLSLIAGGSPTIGRAVTGRAQPGSARAAPSRHPILAHSYNSLLQGLARYEGRTAVLVSFIADHGSCAWLVGASGIIAYGRSDATSADVAQLVASELGPLDLEGRSADRAPVRRNPPVPAETVALAAGTDLPSPWDGTLSDVLFPKDIRKAVHEIDNLIIVPDEQMASFPFALVSTAPTGEQSRPLIESAIIQIAPSLIEVGIGRGLHRNLDTSLATMGREARAELLRSAIIVGDPVYNDIDWRLRPLPGARTEAMAIAGMFGAQPLIGSDATVGRVLERWEASNPVYFHLATHGIADRFAIGGNNSFVALANGDRLNREILEGQRLRDGSIVVLSACQSGLGATIPAGIYGLPRMLQLRGAQTVVMSLWNVDDAATAQLMQRFAHHLLETGRAPTAMALAIRETRQQFADPARWASFAVFGTGPF